MIVIQEGFGLLVTSVNSGTVLHVRGSLKSLLLRPTYVQVVVQNNYLHIVKIIMYVHIHFCGLGAFILCTCEKKNNFKV